MRSKLPSLIGVIHLPALPGAPGSQGTAPAITLQQAGMIAVNQAKTLEKAGFHGLILENFGDVPFYKDRVPPETVASLAVIAAAVRETVKIPIGINILRNDGFSALAVAATTGCDFIRVNVLNGLAATDQGLIEGEAAELAREKLRLGAEDVSILADAHVKHAVALSSRSLALSVEEVALRAGADGVIVTGATTGRAVDMADLEEASKVAFHVRVPLFVGSGTTVENIDRIAPLVHGMIVGSALRKGGLAGAPLDLSRIRRFVKAYESTRRPKRSKTKRSR